jgi:hypothetical protein
MESRPRGTGPTDSPGRYRAGAATGLSALVALLLVVASLRFVGGVTTPAGAVQPYAPRGITVTQVAAGDWFALSVRASGFRPNSTVLVAVGGVDERSLAVDAAGVIDLRIELPDTVGVQVRGVALEGGGLELSEEVGLARQDATLRDLALGLMVMVLLVAVGVVAGPRLRGRFGPVRPVGDGMVERFGSR